MKKLLILAFSACAGGSPVYAQTVTVTAPKYEALIGDSVKYTAVALDVRGRRTSTARFRWSSLDPSTVTVNSNGWAKGVKVGSSLVTAEWLRTDRLRPSAGKALTVLAPVAVLGRFELRPAKTVLTVGDSVRMWAWGFATSGQPMQNEWYGGMRWSVSDAALAGIDGRGMLYTKAPGMVTVTASVLGVTSSLGITILTPPVVVTPQPLPVVALKRIADLPKINEQQCNRFTDSRDIAIKGDTVYASGPHTRWGENSLCVPLHMWLVEVGIPVGGNAPAGCLYDYVWPPRGYGVVQKLPDCYPVSLR